MTCDVECIHWLHPQQPRHHVKPKKRVLHATKKTEAVFQSVATPTASSITT